jgi:hypothetical protein
VTHSSAQRSHPWTASYPSRRGRRQVRVGFHGSADVWTRDVLNLGVRPDTLVQTVRGLARGEGMRQAGGCILEGVSGRSLLGYLAQLRGGGR